jgi:hypothetical protein
MSSVSVLIGLRSVSGRLVVRMFPYSLDWAARSCCWVLAWAWCDPATDAGEFGGGRLTEPVEEKELR